MGRLFVITLEGSVYSCNHCHTHLALLDDIISKTHTNLILYPCFSLSTAGMERLISLIRYMNGSNYLFSFLMHSSVNITVGEKEERMMMTGLHTVVDIFCVGCGSIVGWKYESAHEKTQKYKEGKFILERFKVLGPDGSNYLVNHDVMVSGSDADNA
ncbi:hypothetical protein Goshw_009921 [Gossypium schwendimanii]|uniref:Protein yippee-like n=1 Tax=Gossypium schwendimanii TaxID=34291 RepID=A0A7J9N0V5_GOSSC|nr:hypothetical protein [Gossypium schwendimanii]